MLIERGRNGRVETGSVAMHCKISFAHRIIGIVIISFAFVVMHIALPAKPFAGESTNTQTEGHS